ncbi:hypothetical protein ABID30_002211 [Enterococcus rotai]|uniref:Uncharacterized protein n=1 Tax=Enterococcus rotai TaxID=118060 RepID=A0A0U2XIM6_9ENTE|nr:hypothetical protein [Enterococcus rotai]ALS38481.1 hypothetical protein ATZ35_15405 [Enterococcus rotai]
MNSEILKEQMVVLGMCIYGAKNFVGMDMDYKEYDKGSNFLEYTGGSLSVALNSVDLDEYDEKYWVDSLLEGIRILLSLEDVFADTECLLISVSSIPSDILEGLSFYPKDTVAEIIKEEIKDERFKNIRIDFI